MAAEGTRLLVKTCFLLFSVVAAVVVKELIHYNKVSTDTACGTCPCVCSSDSKHEEIMHG